MNKIVVTGDSHELLGPLNLYLPSACIFTHVYTCTLTGNVHGRQLSQWSACHIEAEGPKFNSHQSYKSRESMGVLVRISVLGGLTGFRGGVRSSRELGVLDMIPVLWRDIGRSWELSATSLFSTPSMLGKS